MCTFCVEYWMFLETQQTLRFYALLSFIEHLVLWIRDNSRIIILPFIYHLVRIESYLRDIMRHTSIDIVVPWCPVSFLFLFNRKLALIFKHFYIWVVDYSWWWHHNPRFAVIWLGKIFRVLNLELLFNEFKFHLQFFLLIVMNLTCLNEVSHCFFLFPQVLL